MDSYAPAPAGTSSRLMNLLAVDETDERHQLVTELVHVLGFDWLAYGQVRRAAGGPDLLDPWQNIGAERWQRHYRDHGYQRVDPRLAGALGSRLPVVWQLDPLRRECSEAGRHFIDDLADTGMRAGVMLALAGSRADERTVVSLLTRDRDPGLAQDDTRIGHVVTLGLCLREMNAQRTQQAQHDTEPGSLRDGFQHGGQHGSQHGGQHGAHDSAPAPLSNALSTPLQNPTQQAILQYLACGLCDKQIAARLALSLHTVDYHMRQLRKRFGARNRVQLAQAAGGSPSPDWRPSNHSDLE
jgi:DNA-binding CsgD family transcriptional regulator